MKRVVQILAGLGCLASLIAPFLALLLYPRAKWLFALPLLGFAILFANYLYRPGPTPEALARQIGRLMSGTHGEWAVDDYENLRPRDEQLKVLWEQSLKIGAPESWAGLNDEQNARMQGIIDRLRELGAERSQRNRARYFVSDAMGKLQDEEAGLLTSGDE